jgi:hypothetical protein
VLCTTDSPSGDDGTGKTIHDLLRWQVRDLTRGGDYAYYADIAHFMAGLLFDQASEARCLDSEQHPRSRWRSLVNARQTHLAARR